MGSEVMRDRAARVPRNCVAYAFGMPVVFRYRGYRFFFYSNEGSPREPLHAHAIGGGGEAKFWLKPVVRVAFSDGLDARTLRELTGVVERNAEIVERTRHEHFG
jgi:hypothetical protein